MDRLLQNLRIGIRGLRRAPGFSTTAILTLALGIGLSTAVFTVADALLIRRLPVTEQDRLILLWGETPDGSFKNYPIGFAQKSEFAKRMRSLDRIAYFGYWGAGPIAVRDGDRISLLARSLVSGDFFDVLGAKPLLGRALRPTDDLAGAAPVIVLSHRAWIERFGGDSAALGKQIVMHMDGVAATVVGVMPRGLDYPRGTDFWAPIMPGTPTAQLQYLGLDVVGRLARGATPTEAREELTAFLSHAGTSVWMKTLRGVANPFPRIVLGDVRPALLAFGVAAALLLLITCINVANLLLVRGMGRMRELAVRSAIGGTRAQLIGLLLTESLVLAVAGGVLGAGVAAATVRTFVVFAPPGLPRIDEIQLNATALGGAVGLTCLAMLIFAVGPAIATSRVELERVLRSDARQSASRTSRLVAEGLVVCQVALALLVLSAAGLIARSLIKLERVQLAFEPSHLLIGGLSMRSDQYNDTKKQIAVLERIASQLAAIPGVVAISPVVAAPFETGWAGRPIKDGQSSAEAAANPMLNMDLVLPGYFAAFDMPVIRGRGFTDADRAGAPGVVVLSESAARHYWPGADPIGKHLRMGDEKAPTFTVVGVVPDTRYRELREAQPSIYFPLRQSFFPFPPLSLAIRTRGPPADLVPTIRRVVADGAPGVALASVTPFEALRDVPMAQPRLNALLLAVFAGAAVALAAIGLFGVMATMVRQRTREMGVRMALGATPGDLRAMVLRRGLSIAAWGLGLGLIVALLTNRLLASMLYEVSPTDGVSLMLAVGSLLAVAAAASAIPARSSTRIDPAIALRAEG